MKRIYKYPVEITDHQILELPIGSTILSVKEQEPNKFYIWALVDPNEPVRGIYEFIIYGTGHPAPLADARVVKYLDTVVATNGLVWHFFYAIGFAQDGFER